jgi:hypothetical protein
MNAIVSIKNLESTQNMIESAMIPQKFIPPPLVKMKARRNLLIVNDNARVIHKPILE